MSLYLGNTKITPIIKEAGAGGDIITAVNKTGSAVSAGDKVWVKGLEYSYNFDVVGLPTIMDKEKQVFNFSLSSFLQLQIPFNPSSNIWEVQIKATTSNDVTTNQKFLHSCKGISNSGRYGIGIIIINGHFGFFSSADGSSWLFDTQGTYSVQTNTTYWLKAGWDGSKYYLEYSTDGETYTRDIDVSNSTATYSSLIYTYLGIMSNTEMQNPFLGTMDLSETKIIVNNAEWWVPTFTPSNNYVLTNLYTQAGGQKVLNPELKSLSATLPTISSEFVATSFTDSNNLGGTFTIPSINYGNFTIYMKIKTPNVSGTKTFLAGHLNLSYIYSSQKLQTWNGASSSIEDLFSSVSRNTVYYIKINVNGTTRTFSISTDNENWTSASITSTSLADKTAINMYYGYSPYTSKIYLSSGSLYLEDIYIKDETSGQVLWRAVEEHISSQITPNTITGFATENIADNASGSVLTILPPEE